MLYKNEGKNGIIDITTATAATTAAGAAAAAAPAIKFGIENIHVRIAFKSFQEQCAIGQRKQKVERNKHP